MSQVVPGMPGAELAASAPACPTPAEVARLHDEVRELARERRAVILAHHYQVPEVQEAGDFTGDSLKLAQAAARTDADVIVMCGVRFMAETVSILCPDRTVLIPDLEAGCSLADSIDAEQLRAWKAKHPGAVVVSYVNTSAEVKAESDYCCTSGNARQIVESIPADREILFLPDMFLGVWLERVTGRRMTLWSGECHVHAGIRKEDVDRVTDRRESTQLLVHPECGCASQAMAFANRRTHVLSTEGMISYARRSKAKRFYVATETGILYGLSKAAPDREFLPMRDDAVCRFMKMITLEKLRDSLRDMRYEVRVAPEVAAKARQAIDRMIAVG